MLLDRYPRRPEQLHRPVLLLSDPGSTAVLPLAGGPVEEHPQDVTARAPSWRKTGHKPGVRQVNPTAIQARILILNRSKHYVFKPADN